MASAYPGLDWGEAENLWEMKTMISQGVQEWVERIRQEAAEEALERGLQQGRQEGVQQGLQQGVQKGRHEGERQGLLEALEVALASRLPDEAEPLMQLARTVGDIDRLKAALRAAVAADTTREAVEAALHGE
ncbi:MAG: hypothetical protein D6739_08340 [Nitrospirae bacterium]|nr:MAG: hypothetical protein D6739_08340 [Nitrospirota bacterium]